MRELGRRENMDMSKTVEATVMRHGRTWTPPAPDSPLPEGVELGAAKQCYRNAALVALSNPEYTYVEGYAASIIPIHHAWVVDRDGQVVDPTWHEDNGLSPAKEYVGVPFSREFLGRRLVQTGVFGLFDWQHPDILGDGLDGLEFDWLPEHLFDEYGVRTDDEEKALRRVRTPDGARRFGQPIGSVIKPDLPEVRDLPNVSPTPARRRNGAEILAARPWDASAEDLRAGRVRGVYVDETISPGLAGHRYDHERVTVSAEFPDDTPFNRFLLVAHEIGHDVAADVLSGPPTRWRPVLEPFRRPEDGEMSIRSRFDNPFGGSDRPEEMLADAYAELLTFGLADREPDSKSRALLNLVAASARALGYPDDRLPDRPEAPPSRLDPKAAYASISPELARSIRKRRAATKFYAQRRDGKTVEEAQAIADAYEQAQLRAALAGALEVPPPKPPRRPRAAGAKRYNPFAPRHPDSGRGALDMRTRGGDGDQPGGYVTGQIVRVVDGWREDTNYRVGEPHPRAAFGVLAIEPIDGTDPYGHRAVHYSTIVPVADAEPHAVDVGREIEPTLGAVDAATSELTLADILPADTLAHMRRMLRERRRVAVETREDVERGILPDDMVGLVRAKRDGLASLGAALGMTPAEAGEAAVRLRELLAGWSLQGGMHEARGDMQRAVRRLRAGGRADDVDTRAMLLQRAWHNLTWTAKYGPDPDRRVQIGRWVHGPYAASIVGALKLTKPLKVPDPKPGDSYATREIQPMLRREDVKISAHALTAWSVTPGGVRSGWIGRDVSAVLLSREIRRDDAWLNVWSESMFRTRGLKAPGEVIVDETVAPTAADMEITLEDVSSTWWTGGPTGSLASVADVFVSHALRSGEYDQDAVLAAWIYQGRPGIFQEFFSTEIVHDMNVALPREALSTRHVTFWRHRETGEVTRRIPTDEQLPQYERFHGALRYEDEYAREFAVYDNLVYQMQARGWTARRLIMLAEAIDLYAMNLSRPGYYSSMDEAAIALAEIRRGEALKKARVTLRERLVDMGLDEDEAESRIERMTNDRLRRIEESRP